MSHEVEDAKMYADQATRMYQQMKIMIEQLMVDLRAELAEFKAVVDKGKADGPA